MLNTAINIPILFEDATLLVIDKPANIVVNRAESVKTGTVQDWVDENFKPASPARLAESERAGGSQNSHPKAGRPRAENLKDTDSEFISRSGIVHRIDKETSGCLMIAKNLESFYALQASFKSHEVTKEYIALIHGHLVPKEGSINAPIGRLPWNREHFGVVPGGKEAHTKYIVNNYYKNYTLVALYPKSGRTHQLRVHMKYLGFPIVGDYLYGGRKQMLDDRRFCPRVFLHAAKISFPHPVTKNMIEVMSKLPSDLQKVLGLLHSSQTSDV